MNEQLQVSSSPHVRSRMTTSFIMKMVVVSLLPATFMGIYNFGLNAIVTICICVIASVLAEALYERFLGKKSTVKDFSAVVTGLLLALNLPPKATWWMALWGSLFAIIVVKQLFGGLGQNFMNPALGARCFLMICFAGRMTDFSLASKGFSKIADTVSTATPLAALKAGESVGLLPMFLGNTKGTIGETSALALLCGAVILLIFKIIDLKIPLAYIGSFALFILVFGGRGFDFVYLAKHLCGGGLMLGAWFMATDYATKPITEMGQIVYGIVLGVLTGIFRIYGGSAEGVSYAIIFSNLLVPLIEKVTFPKAFGRGGKRA